MAFKATLISVVDLLSLIYFELQLLQIHEFSPFLQVTLQNGEIREFATTKTRNISDLEGRLLFRLVSLTILWSLWWNFFL